LAEITAIKDGDEARISKICRLVKAVQRLEEFTGVTFETDR
jgi:hypothetical protein